MAKALMLRFLDDTDTDNQFFVTVFLDGPKKGMIKRDDKELIQQSPEGTTCRVQKGKLTEVRLMGYGWRELDENKFQSYLNEINKVRIKNGWTSVCLPNKNLDASAFGNLPLKHSCT